MVKALARAFWWEKMLDAGVYATREDLARAKVVAPSYVSRVLRLTLRRCSHPRSLRRSWMD